MIVGKTVSLAGRALLRNKMRSFLTMLGVIIGVASVISMVAVGEGAKSRVEKAFAGMGTNILIVLSGSTRSGGMMGGFGSMPTLTWDDLEAIRKEAPSVASAAPQMNARITVQSEDANWTTTVTGTSPEFLRIRAWKIARGTTFGESEIEGSAKVIILGQTVSDRIFGPGIDPIGRTIRMRGVPFVVIGLLERKGQSPMGQNYDDTAIVPYTTFQTKLQGSLGKFIPGIIVVSAKSNGETGRAEKQIESILRDRHHLASATEDDFDVRNLTEIANAQQAGTKALTGLLAAIAVVSLVVGGIGIMNIMLVSVTERTREIGLRMAIGAKPSQVLAQFLVESMALSMAGGLVGIAFGTVLARWLATKLGWPFSLRVDMIFVAFFFSALVGVLFGLYPARKASHFDPIEALRFE
jgi:putative ABC transport system permease protein